MQLPSTGNFKFVGAIALLDPKCHVVYELTIETLLDIARRHVLPFTTGEGRIIDLKCHAHRGLIDAQRWQCLRMGGITKRIGDVERIDARNADNITRFSAIGLNALQPEITHDLQHFAGALITISVNDGDRRIGCQNTAGNSANADHANVTVVIKR